MAEIKKLSYQLSADSLSLIVTKPELPAWVKLKKALVSLKSKSTLSANDVYNVKCTLNDETTIIDKIHSLTTGKVFKINITEELQKAIDKNLSITLNFEKVDSQSINLALEEPSMDEISSSDVEYISKAEYSKNSSYHSVNLGTAGQANINLNTGVLSLVHQDVACDNNVLPLTISHVYNSFRTKLPKLESISNYYGNGWKLNLEQYITCDNSSNSEYIYFDENGKKQTIIEKYYYNSIDENDKTIKVYIERTDDNLSMNLDGNLQYNKGENGEFDIVPIKTEWEAPNGFKMVTKKEDICGANLVDSEPEELIEIKRQIKNLELNKTNIENTIKSSKEQLISLALSRKALKIQLTSQDINLQANKEELTFINNIKANKKIVAIGDVEEADIAQANQEINKEDWEKTYGEAVEENGSTYYEGSYNLQNQIYNNNLEIYSDKLLKNDLSTLVKEEISSEYFNQIFTNGIDTNVDYIQNYYDDINNYNTELNKENGIQISYKDIYTIDIQIKGIVENIENYKIQLEECKTELKKLFFEKNVYTRQIPKFYLYNDNVIYGFSPIVTESYNENGETSYTEVENIYRLNYIADTYENSIVINYEKNTNKIVSIIDSQDNVITFDYKSIKDDSGVLTDYVVITGADESKITFKMQNNLLLEAKYNDGTTSNYLYDENKNLVAAIGANGIGAKFSYDSGKVCKVQEVSTLSKIEDEKASFVDSPFNLENLDNLVLSNRRIELEYLNNDSTTISSYSAEKLTNSLSYVFDEAGRVRTIYENMFDDTKPNYTPAVKAFEYFSNTKKIIVEPMLNSENYMGDVCFEGSALKQVPSNYLANGLLEGGEMYCGDDIYCESYPVHTSYHSLTAENTELKSYLCVSTDSLAKINSLIAAENPQTRFVLGCWAKADSAFVFNSDSGEDIETYPDYIKTRKFEIRAEVSYLDGTTTNFSKCFDWTNKAWQYVALPIELLKNESISQIKCYIDYSNNIAPIYFTDFTLKEAAFEEQTFNNKLLTESISSHSKWKQVYEYNENNKLTKLYYYNTEDNTQEPLITEYFYNKNGKLFKTIGFNGIVTEKVFNDQGVEIQTKTYHKLEPSEIMFSEQKLGDKGELLADYNELGREINSYEYVSGTGNISTIKDGTGNVTAYGYDTKNGTLLQMSSNVNGISNTNTYGYTLNFLTKISHNNFNITYDYDNQGRVTKIKVADADYLTFAYSQNGLNSQSTITYSNNQSFRTVTDKNGNVIEVYYKESLATTEIPILENIYDTHGNLIAVNDKVTNTTTEYTLDKFGNIMLQEDTQHNLAVKKQNSFDAENNNTATKYTIGTNTQNYLYSYNTTKPESVLNSVTLPTNAVQSVLNDNLGRTKEIALTSADKAEKRLFHYLKSGLHTSNQVSSIW